MKPGAEDSEDNRGCGEEEEAADLATSFVLYGWSHRRGAQSKKEYLRG
jgi:hypothetical protein